MRRLIQVEKGRQIGGGMLVRAIHSTLLDAEAVLDKPENAPEVAPTVVNVSGRRETTTNGTRKAYW
jgi:hypothetical protein